MKTFAAILFSFLFTIYTMPCHSQSWAWAQGAAGNSSSTLMGSCTDPGGNVLIAGFYDTASVSFGSQTLNYLGAPPGATEAYLFKFDANGNALWARSFGNRNVEEATGVSTDQQGNIFLAGISSDTVLTIGSITLHSLVGTKVLLVKYDPNGNVLWAKITGGPFTNYAALSVDPAGNVFMTGTFAMGSATFGSTVLTNLSQTSGTNIFIAKFDTNGNQLWAKQAGGAINDHGNSIAADASGNAYVAGDFYSPSIQFGAATLTNTNGSLYSDAFIAKYDANGNVLWAKGAGGISGFDAAQSVCADVFGNVIITGGYRSSTISFGTVTLSNSTTVGLDNIFIAKYDASGNVIWAETAGGTNNDTPTCIRADRCGNTYITGILGSASAAFGGLTLLPSNGNCPGGCGPLFIAEYTASGHAVAVSSLSSGDIPLVCVDTLNDVYVSGSYQSSPFNVGSSSFPYQGGGVKAFVAKYISGALSACFTQVNPLCVGVCNGKAIAQVTGGERPFTYSWNSEPPQTKAGADSLCTGSYVLTIKDAGGKTTRDTVMLSPILLPPLPFLGGDQTVEGGQTVQLHSFGGPFYSWSPSTGLSCDNCPDPSVTPAQTTTYCVTETDTIGCRFTSCITLSVECGQLYVPNYFSPNSDGKNDKLCVYGSCIKTIAFKIFDRWGETVFETNDPKDSWDGTYKGQLMDSGAFVYSLDATLTSGEAVKQKGNVNLVR